MILSGTRFGEVQYNQSDIFYFKEGLLGFSQCQHFLLHPHSETSVFKWLQNIEEPSLAWPIVNPCIYVPDYQIDSSIDKDKYTEVFGIVNIPTGRPLEGTINLIAPIIIDLKKLLGKQVILETTNYQVKYPLFDDLKKSNHSNNAA